MKIGPMIVIFILGVIMGSKLGWDYYGWNMKRNLLEIVKRNQVVSATPSLTDEEIAQIKITTDQLAEAIRRAIRETEQDEGCQ